jgi:hypothetical protein
MRNTRLGSPTAPRGDGSRDYVQSLKSQYPGAIITQSYLRSEIQLGTTATSQFAFNILANQGTPGSTERRLQITDRFAVTAVGMMMYNATGVAGVVSSADRAQAKLYTYNSPARFTTANSVTLETVYNGFLRMIIDGTTYIDSLDTRRFYRVPTSQYGTAVSAFTPDTATKFGAIQVDGWDGTHYNFAQMTPAVVLNGAGRNEVTLNTPEATAVSPSATSCNFLVLYLRGWLIQNASTLNR